MSVFQSLTFLCLLILSIAFLISFLRLVRGPSLADRVVAFDVMTTIGMGFVAVYAIGSDQSVFLDIVTVVALMAFLATLAFAYYMRKKV